MPNITNIKKYKNIHMIGIGGVSMSGIAAILSNWGFTVTGSDRSSSVNTDKLISMGIKVVIGHDLADIASSDVTKSCMSVSYFSTIEICSIFVLFFSFRLFTTCSASSKFDTYSFSSWFYAIA